jgi:hypothetical protein
MTQPTAATTSSSSAPQGKSLPKKKQRRWYQTPFAWFLLLSPPEALNFATIFTMLNFCVDVLFMVPVRFIIFPLSATLGLLKAGSLWFRFKETYDENKEKRYSADPDERRKAREAIRIDFLQALWDTLNALGTTGAVLVGVVGFFTGAAVGMGISITFTTLLCMSTLVCLAYTCYFAVTASHIHDRWKAIPLNDRIAGNPSCQAHQDALVIEEKWKALPDHDKTEDNPLYQTYQSALQRIEAWRKLSSEDKAKGHPLYQEYEDRYNKFKINARWFGIVSLLAIGCGLAFVGGMTLPGWIIGGTGCLIAASYSAYTFYQIFIKKKEDTQAQVISNISTTAATLQATGGQRKSKELAEEKRPLLQEPVYGSDDENSQQPESVPPPKRVPPVTGSFGSPYNAGTPAAVF